MSLLNIKIILWRTNLNTNIFIKTDGYYGKTSANVVHTDLGKCMSKLVYFCHLECINRDVKCQLIGAAGGHRAGEEGWRSPDTCTSLLEAAAGPGLGLLLPPRSLQSLITDHQLGHQHQLEEGTRHSSTVEMSDLSSAQVRVVLLGHSGVGKTAILSQFLHNTFEVSWIIRISF